MSRSEKIRSKPTIDSLLHQLTEERKCVSLWVAEESGRAMLAYVRGVKVRMASLRERRRKGALTMVALRFGECYVGVFVFRFGNFAVTAPKAPFS
ncbi:MAG: hypothetical protein N3B10_10310 [Armatimonadetes bacterium]|nr:hypothetical protein [Armatimonadota bacterium]